MDNSSYCDKVFQKRFYGTHHNPFPLSLVFQMQKECFSLPAIKATITLFLYTNGKKKYMYMNLYTNIFMQMWSGWINTTTSHHPKSMDHLERPVDSRELWDLQFDTRKGQGRGSPNGRDYKHACANHLLDTFQATVFTPNIYS